MFRRKQPIYKRIFPIFGTLAGTVLAVLGIRKGVQWYQQRQVRDRFDTSMPETAWPSEPRYQHMDQPYGAPIPATGPAPAAPPMTEMTTEERINSDMVTDFDDRGTAFSTTEMSSTRADEINLEDRPVTGSMAGDIYGGAETRTGAERTGMDTGEMGGPWTGTTTGMGSMTGQQPDMGQTGSTQRSELVMDEFVAPLIEHAIAFNSVMNLLRSRQRDGEGNEGVESLTEGDRNSMRAVLDQMQEHVADYDETAMRGNPLAMRSYNLTNKLREALDNLEYTGSDLYRIQDEIRKELCGLTRELDDSGQVTITGLDQIRQLYECQ